MAKKSSIENNKRRMRYVERFQEKRRAVKAVARNKTLTVEERFQACLKIAAMPRNSCAVRVRNRCSLTGRPRGVYRKFQISRIVFRDWASMGLMPGITKSSW